MGFKYSVIVYDDSAPFLTSVLECVKSVITIICDIGNIR